MKDVKPLTSLHILLIAIYVKRKFKKQIKIFSKKDFTSDLKTLVGKNDSKRKEEMMKHFMTRYYKYLKKEIYLKYYKRTNITLWDFLKNVFFRGIMNEREMCEFVKMFKRNQNDVRIKKINKFFIYQCSRNRCFRSQTKIFSRTYYFKQYE